MLSIHQGGGAMSSRKERLEVVKKEPLLAGLGIGAKSPNQVTKIIQGLRVLGIEFTEEDEKKAKVVAQLKKSNPEGFKAFFRGLVECRETKESKAKRRIDGLKESVQKKLGQEVSKIEAKEKADRKLLARAQKMLEFLRNIVSSSEMRKLFENTEREVVIIRCNVGKYPGHICLRDRDYSGLRDIVSSKVGVYHYVENYPYFRSNSYSSTDCDEIIAGKLARGIQKDSFDFWQQSARVKVLAGLTEEKIWRQINKQM